MFWSLRIISDWRLNLSSLFRIWNALMSNYGRVMPVDWKQSRTCSLHIPTFSLEEKLVSDATPPIPSLCPTFPSTPAPLPPKISHVRSSHKSQIFIVPGLALWLISLPLFCCQPEKDRCHGGAVRRRGAEGAAGHALHHRIMPRWGATFHSRTGELHYKPSVWRVNLQQLNRNPSVAPAEL